MVSFGAVGARPSNAVTDLLLCAELTTCLIIWLRTRPGGTKKHELYVSYALNLLGGAAWTASGVYVHLFEPLPQEATATWQFFLNMGATTPFLFPLVVRDAFYRSRISSSAARMQDVTVALCAVLYALLVNSSVDLAAGRKLPPLAVTPWHAIDGRCYGGEQYGITFDLLSTMPTARSDSQFVLSMLFMASNALSALMMLNICYGTKDLAPSEFTLARRLTVGVFAMLMNCHVLAILVAGGFASSAASLDIFHVGQGLIIGASFCQLRRILKEKVKDV
mmetsp:Transcript_56947/g.106811  ORF Transcript_56947/g.106811 Transcript_56947/m.106811 type:complete len:278 (-) Transcript_56947:181-1014(-)